MIGPRLTTWLAREKHRLHERPWLGWLGAKNWVSSLKEPDFAVAFEPVRNDWEWTGECYAVFWVPNGSIRYWLKGAIGIGIGCEYLFQGMERWDMATVVRMALKGEQIFKCIKVDPTELFELFRRPQSWMSKREVDQLPVLWDAMVEGLPFKVSRQHGLFPPGALP